MTKVFLTGGSGFVGRSFIKFLLTESKNSSSNSIVALSRSEKSDNEILSAAEEFKSSVCVVRGDVNSSLDQMTTHLQSCDVVVHLAAKVEPWGKWDDFLQINVKGTENLLKAAKNAGVKRFVHCSTEAVLLSGFQNGCYDNVDETAPLSLNPPFYAPYTQSKAMQEVLVRDANDADGNFTTIILRPRFIWGKGDTTLIPALVKAVKSGAYKWFQPSPQANTCHVRNLCSAFELAFTKGVPGTAYFIVDKEGPIDLNNFIKRLISPLVDTSNISNFSTSILWSLVTVLENVPFLGFGTTLEPFVNRQVLGLVGQNILLRADKAKLELDFVPHVSIEDGFEELYPSSSASDVNVVVDVNK